MIAALYGAYGAMMAVYARGRTGRGQCIDLSLFESAFSFMEPHVPAYDQLGLVPERMGSGLPNSAPNDLYPTREGGYVHIAAFGEAVFRRFAEAIGRPDLAENEKFAKLVDRAHNKEELNEIVGEWTARHTTEEVESVLLAAGVPASRVYTIADIFANAHYAVREMLPAVPHPTLGEVRLAGVVPKLSETPGAIRWPGAAIGAHTRDVLSELLGYPPARIDALARDGAIRCES
jgi:crotonobetainyl-CoA:carnitine CoA-transferase CaiB-like acyl-CoA transferase